MSYMGHVGFIPDLDTLVDVVINTPLNNHVLNFNSLTDRWENHSIKDMAITCNELADFEIKSPVDNQFLMYDSSKSKWVNKFYSRKDRAYYRFLTSD